MYLLVIVYSVSDLLILIEVFCLIPSNLILIGE